MERNQHEFVDRILRFWRGRGIPHLEGVTPATLEAFERERNIWLPDEMKAFYLATNGLRVPGTSETDDRYYDFWPISELNLTPSAELEFADVQQSAWTFSIELKEAGAEPKGTVYVSLPAPIPIAPSFGSFIDLYIADDERLYPSSWYQGD